jgi:hypothetical protein
MRSLQALVYEILPKLDPQPSWEMEFILTILSESTSVSKLETLGQNSVQQWGAESSLTCQWLPAAGGDGAWAARTDSRPMRMCGDIFAAARLWRGRLLTTGHLSSRHPVVVGAGDVE